MLNIDSIENKNLLKAVKEIEGLGYKVINRDYTNDIDIPTVRTWIVNPNNYTMYATSGFGTSLSPEIALERSVTEAVQSIIPPKIEEVTRYSRANDRDLVYSRDSIYGLHYFQQKDINIDDSTIVKDINIYNKKDYSSIDDLLSEVIEKIKHVIPDCDILFVDLTRDAIGIPVVRVLITGDIQRLSLPLITASKRLFEFQKKMRYSDKVPSYEELYMGPYPH